MSCVAAKASLLVRTVNVAARIFSPSSDICTTETAPSCSETHKQDVLGNGLPQQIKEIYNNILYNTLTQTLFILRI